MSSARNGLWWVLPVVLSACGGGGEQVKVGTPKGGGGDVASSTLKLPGACVDPLQDGDAHDAARPFNKHVQFDRPEDLDGDGVADTFVKPGWDCGITCNHSAYVARSGGSCAHYVGTFPSVDNYDVLDEKSNGLKDLKTRPRKTEDDGQVHCYQAILKFDGAVYKESKRRECECKSESPKCTAWGE